MHTSSDEHRDVIHLSRRRRAASNCAGSRYYPRGVTSILWLDLTPTKSRL